MELQPIKITGKTGRKYSMGKPQFQNLIKMIDDLGYGTKKKIYNRKRLTREEMWNAICSKYPTLENFTINSRYKDNRTYQGRDTLFKLIIEMKIHKSRHLKKAQKQKVEYELNEKVLNKI